MSRIGRHIFVGQQAFLVVVDVDDNFISEPIGEMLQIRLARAHFSVFLGDIRIIGDFPVLPVRDPGAAA